MELLTNPITYLVGVIVALAVLELKKGKKCSTKSCEPNKTSHASSGKKEVAKKMAEKIASTPKKTATKKTAKKKVAKKKVAKKTTPKKSVKET